MTDATLTEADVRRWVADEGPGEVPAWVYALLDEIDRLRGTLHRDWYSREVVRAGEDRLDELTAAVTDGPDRCWCHDASDARCALRRGHEGPHDGEGAS